MNTSVVTMMFDGRYVPFQIFADGTAKYTVGGVIRWINDFAEWFIDAVQRGWQKVAEYNLPDNASFNHEVINIKHTSQSEEFRTEWYDYEEDNLDNWGD